MLRLSRLSRLFAALALAASASAAELSFNRDVRPILSDKCFACHGLDAKKRKAGLRLDVPESATAIRDGVQAIKPGDPAGSDAWIRINSADEDEAMPPPDAHKPLSPAEKETLKRWIEQGAKFQKHWAFESPLKAAPPREGNPIDAFTAQRLAAEKLAISPETDRATLIRRAALALTGLPPTPAEADAFIADAQPGAFERVVDRLLASPRFGERMAQPWLDLARYADTHGLHLDNERQMWAYRDWVIGAFNRNQPFDEFTIEQLAGDLLPNPTNDQLAATGFARCNVTTGEGGSIDAEWIFRNAVERTSTTISTWMGLTAGCAVCHDHKFDPISQKEFYSLYSFFLSAADPPLDGNLLLTPPFAKLKKPDDEKKLTDLDQATTAAKAKLDDTVAKITYTDPATLQPPPPVKDIDVVWIDDDWPAGAKVTAAGGWHEAAGGAVHSGAKAIRRKEAGLGQVFYEGGAAPLVVPAEGKLYFHVMLDAADLPKSVMLQLHVGAWNRRAVWGDAGAIEWGAPNTPERVAMGPLPAAGAWVRLEVDAAKLNLPAGTQIGGVAFTQFGGTVTWDKFGIAGRENPATDIRRSFAAWLAQNDGKDAAGAPGEINALLKTKDRKPEQIDALRRHYLTNGCADTQPVLGPLAQAVAAAKKARDDFDNAIPGTFVMRDLPQPREAFVMQRGAYDKPGDKTARAVPAIFPQLTAEKPTRLELARWLVSPEHPLTARVAVNRIWQQFFGTGLVKSSGDFGSQGEPPSHPELLDWLAVDFRETGWDVKKLVRKIVTSATWRQASRATPELLARDPENRLLARGPRLRLEAEQIRDNALFVSGLLIERGGGRGDRIYQPPNLWEPVGFTGSNTANYTQDKGEALYRRSIYAFVKRTAPPPFMSNFDAPSREQSCARRERSNTPLQALQLMNDVQHIEAARVLAERTLADGGKTLHDQLTFAFRCVLARPPTGRELTIAQDSLARHLAAFQSAPEEAAKLIRFGERPPREGVNAAELAAWTMIGNLLLNLDETVTQN